MIVHLIFGCVTSTPSDDPFLYDVDTRIEYSVEYTEPAWVVPSSKLPQEVNPMASNNNVEIAFHDGLLFMAWRSAPTHFASADTIMYIMSSHDMGKSWDYEHEIAISTDVREPRFLSFQGRLQFAYFEAGDNPGAFEPKHLWRIFRTESGWSAPEVFLDEESVMWDWKVRNGVAYMTTYDGAHYSEGSVFVRFWQSDDGLEWKKVDNKDFVYEGGVSEVAFEFDLDGGIWAVGRNEDGDQSGAGSQVCFAAAQALAEWNCLDESDPERYDSPEMFRHGKDIYLLARKDIGGTFGPEGDLLAYSFRAKGFALYQIKTDTQSVEHVMDLPGVGDTSFPSVHRLSAHEFFLSNYTSPLDDPDVTWFDGQTSDRGTQIYTTILRFLPK